MLRLSAFSEAIAALGRGRDIAVKAYTLTDRLIHEIELRAKDGANVSVTITRFWSMLWASPPSQAAASSSGGAKLATPVPHTIL